MNKLINKARHIPVDEPVSTISITPVMLDAAGRPKPIEMRITEIGRASCRERV